jgi:hypothetical protein
LAREHFVQFVGYQFVVIAYNELPILMHTKEVPRCKQRVGQYLCSYDVGLGHRNKSTKSPCILE